MSKFQPIGTVADLDILDQDEVVRGYREAKRGDPEPGLNRGLSYWHGWRNRMMDYGELEPDEASRRLASEALRRWRVVT